MMLKTELGEYLCIYLKQNTKTKAISPLLFIYPVNLFLKCFSELSNLNKCSVLPYVDK